MKYLARKRCTCLSQTTIFEKSHSAWSGAPRPIWTEITLGLSSTPAKDGGRVRPGGGYPFLAGRTVAFCGHGLSSRHLGFARLSECLPNGASLSVACFGFLLGSASDADADVVLGG